MARKEDRDKTIAQSAEYVRGGATPFVRRAAVVKFGVEIEFRVPHMWSGYRGSGRDKCAGYALERVREVLPNGWEAKTEVGAGLEVTSQIYADLPPFAVAAGAACAGLRSLGAETDPHDNHDAFHVHIDIASLGVARARHLGLSYYARLDDFNARFIALGARRWALPCGGAESYLTSDALRGEDLSRCPKGKCRCRPAVNIHHFGTLEFRQHPGTLDHKAMVAWVRELYGLANVALSPSAVESAPWAFGGTRAAATNNRKNSSDTRGIPEK